MAVVTAEPAGVGTSSKSTLVGWVQPPMLRRCTTRAMHLYRQGLPLPLLADYLGHASVESTKIYANYRVLHRVGEKPHVTWSQRCRNSTSALRAPAA